MNGELFAADLAEQPAAVATALEANRAAVADVRSMLAGLRSIRLLAIGSSRHAAGYGGVCIDLLAGVPTVVLPAPGAHVPAPRCGPDDLLVAVSQSGRTPALAAAVEAERSTARAVVAVTNQPGGPLDDLADVVLACRAGDERVVAATKSVLTAAALLRALAADVDVDALLAGVRDALALDLGVVARGRPPASVVCDGVAAEWIADEVALKFAEVAGVVAASEPLVEHLHGPVAAGGPTLALLGGHDANAADLAGRDEVVVVRPPSTGDPTLDPLVALVVGQRLAAAWASSLGVDPDDARGLAKVTTTA